MRNISWCPCLNTRLNLHISINCDKRAVVLSASIVEHRQPSPTCLPTGSSCWGAAWLPGWCRASTWRTTPSWWPADTGTPSTRRTTVLYCTVLCCTVLYCTVLYRYALDPENYVLGAFFHYLDILQLFLAILMVICGTNQCLK